MIAELRRVLPMLNQLEEAQLLAGIDAGATSDAPASPVPELSAPFERAIAHEAMWIARAAHMAKARMEHDTAEARLRDRGAQALRGVHGKTHGCVEATFCVREDLPARFAHGVLQPGVRHRALVRFSNALPGRPDRKPDARGLSIKLLDVGAYGSSAAPAPLDDGLSQRGLAVTQDFLLVSHPTFFIKDIRDYTLFRGAADAPGKAEKLRRMGLFFSLRPLEAWIFGRTLFRSAEDPFAVEYHSMLASLLGPSQAVKYVVTGPVAEAVDIDRNDPDFLRAVMRRRLDPARTRGGAAVQLEFSLVVGDAEPLPVEDPRIDWEARGARRIPVARIEIPPQDFAVPSRVAACERLVFNPWHSLQQHKPLGSLSRARRVVYQRSAQTRYALNAWESMGTESPAR